MMTILISALPHLHAFVTKQSMESDFEIMYVRSDLTVRISVCMHAQSLLQQTSCVEMPARKPNAVDPFKAAPKTKRGLQKKAPSPGPLDALKSISTADFHEKQFLFEISATEDFFQKIGGQVTHFLVRGVNETRVVNLRYVGAHLMGGLGIIRVGQWCYCQ